MGALARADHTDSHESDEHMDELTISLVATWDSFAAGIFVSPESVEYNGDDNVWYFGNWFADNATDLDKAGEIGTLSGDYPVTSATDFGLQENIMDTLAAVPAGMVYSDGFLFVADIGLGVVHKFNTETNEYVAGSTFINPVANGLCLDEDNNMLYVTTTGWDFNTGENFPERSGLYAVDPDTLDWTRVYDGVAPTGFPDDYVFNPNGCYVNDGAVYMVDVQLAGLGGSLGIYNIESGELTRDAVVLATHPVCDGIVYYDGFWFVSDVGQGQLLALNTAETDGIFEVVIDGLDGAADICLGPDNTIAIPSVGNGTIWFAQFEIGHDHDDSDDNSAGKVGLLGALMVVAAALF